MFIRILYDGVEDEDTEGQALEETIECRGYTLKRLPDGLYISMDNNERIRKVSGCSVFVMNREGRTIDTIG